MDCINGKHTTSIKIGEKTIEVRQATIDDLIEVVTRYRKYKFVEFNELAKMAKLDKDIVREEMRYINFLKWDDINQEIIAVMEMIKLATNNALTNEDIGQLSQDEMELILNAINPDKKQETEIKNA